MTDFDAHDFLMSNKVCENDQSILQHYCANYLEFSLEHSDVVDEMGEECYGVYYAIFIDKGYTDKQLKNSKGLKEDHRMIYELNFIREKRDGLKYYSYYCIHEIEMDVEASKLLERLHELYPSIITPKILDKLKRSVSTMDLSDWLGDCLREEYDDEMDEFGYVIDDKRDEDWEQPEEEEDDDEY